VEKWFLILCVIFNELIIPIQDLRKTVTARRFNDAWAFLRKSYSQDTPKKESHMLHSFIRTALALALLPMAFLAQAKDTPQNLSPITLQMGKHKIRAQVAKTADQRTIGLMHRKTMPVNEGMLFVFEKSDTQCFWMKNTLLPLSAAFILDNGEVVNMEDMKPQTLSPHCSQAPVRYVLEMNQGWFKKRGLEVGGRLEGLPVLP
jgi:uncharacterized protein